MKKSLFLLLLSSLLISATPTVIDAPEILNFAEQSMPHQGPLKKTSEGFVYVKVPNDYILETLTLLKVDKAEAPAYFGQGKVGAHITVIDADESKGRALKLPPMGTMIPFKIVNFSSVDVTNEHGSKRIYMFTVEAPELEKIRLVNGLPPKVRGFDFHITAAIQYLAGAPSEVEPSS
ncbi:MAG: hypothetical protein JSS60_06140 [Verrucomicrobia bacterium]|nr:hypothetical protein [Verrucomicrobiota bacterium]